MMRFISRKIHKASDLTSIIHVGNFSPIASEAAQVQHSTILPKKSMHGGKAGGFSGSRIDVRKSGYLAALVDVLGECVRATQGAEINYLAVMPEDSDLLRNAR